MGRVDLNTEGIILPWENITSQFLVDIAERVIDSTTSGPVRLSLIVTGNDYIRSMNAEYRKIDKPTDVLSFAERECPFPDDDGEEGEYLGDIFISIERADEQAPEYGNSLRQEMARLIVHGLLHLIGYDHERSGEDARAMEAKEEELLRTLRVE